MTATNRPPLAERLGAALLRCSTVQDVAAGMFATLRTDVPFSFGCLATTDPLSGVITWAYKSHPLGIGDEQFTATEYGEPDVNQFAEIARRPAPVGVLSRDTDGHPERCRRFRDFLSPELGFTDEVRLVVRERRLTWGALALYRSGDDAAFSAQDADRHLGITGVVCDAIRRALFADRPVVGEEVPEPAVLVVDAAGRPRQMTRAARDRIDDLGGWDNGSLPAGILAVAAKARSGTGVFASRARLLPGQWLSVRASQLDEPDGAGPHQNGAAPHARPDVVVTIDVAHPSELTGLTLAGRGLTAREQEIATLVVQGASTRSIAATLHLSPHTVQDHLKSVFAKLGVNSRRELVGQIYG